MGSMLGFLRMAYFEFGSMIQDTFVVAILRKPGGSRSMEIKRRKPSVIERVIITRMFADEITMSLPSNQMFVQIC